MSWFVVSQKTYEITKTTEAVQTSSNSVKTEGTTLGIKLTTYGPIYLRNTGSGLVFYWEDATPGLCKGHFFFKGKHLAHIEVYIVHFSFVFNVKIIHNIVHPELYPCSM